MNRTPIFRTGEGEFIDMNSKEDLEWCKQHYPAFSANRPSNMSEDYQFMPTHKMATDLQNQFGLRMVEIGQQFSRSRDPRGQEHFAKFRMPSSLMNLAEVGDSAPELVLMNSHNGRMTVRAYAGVFRFVCANGMVVSEKSFGKLALRHFGVNNTYEAFSELLGKMATGVAILDSRMAKMNAVLLDRGQQVRLAREVMAQRGVPTWVEPEHALQVHRPSDQVREDGLRSLWVTFNVIQENLTSRDVVHAPENARPVRMRPLVGARAHVITNERVWHGLDAFIEKELGHLTGELLEAQVAPKLQIAAPKPAPRGATAILALATYDEVCGVTPAELELLTKEQRTKLSSRKSYLKKKERVDA